MPLAMVGNARQNIPAWRDRPDAEEDEGSRSSLSITAPDEQLSHAAPAWHRHHEGLRDFFAVSMALSVGCSVVSFLRSEAPAVRDSAPTADPVAAAKARWQTRARQRARFMEAALASAPEMEDLPTPPIEGE